MNERKFLKQYPEADRDRHPEIDGQTARAYQTQNFLWLFDKTDGHLAWKFDKRTNKVLYECEHIKKGRGLL